MIDFWAKLAFNQLELAMNITRVAFGIAEREAPVSVHTDSVVDMVPDDAVAPAENLDASAGVLRNEPPIIGILSFLETAHQGATVRQIAERLETDKMTVLPLLKTLVKEGRIDELLGRYCVLRS